MRNGGRNKHVRLLACHDWHDWYVLFDFCYFFANYIHYIYCFLFALAPSLDLCKTNKKMCWFFGRRCFYRLQVLRALSIITGSSRHCECIRWKLFTSRCSAPCEKDENHASQHIEAGRSHIRVLSIVDLGWIFDFRSEASCTNWFL